MDWQIEDRMPRYDDIREFEVWLRNGSTRTVRRVGNRSLRFTPGMLLYTDCTHPLQNVICDESDVVGWRHRAAPCRSTAEAS